MSNGASRLDRLEVTMLLYHFPKASSGQGGATTYTPRTIELQQLVRDLELKGREAMIQRAYSKFMREGLVARSGFGFKITEKGMQLVRSYKKLHASM